MQGQVEISSRHFPQRTKGKEGKVWEWEEKAKGLGIFSNFTIFEDPHCRK